MRLKKRLMLYFVTLVALGVLTLPIVITVAFGWVHDWSNSVNAYFVLVLVYVVWTPAVMFTMVAVLDRLGIHYAVHDRPARPTRKERRRARAGLRYLAGQEEARRAVEQARAAQTRERARRASAPPPAGESAPRAPDAPPAGERAPRDLGEE